ncbi:sigma-54 interaction domain-containing protein [Maridesulfovibrio bastinii]|uniref:sigma-54 interaction domain-containing protein n=1 Tax=Maridesulfovibrio bastinii TaxID=47157 RepID=UPI0003FCD20C|nr:sigma 54-interacting transcriptional regulator [Maridesulfovibrio bastinii]
MSESYKFKLVFKDRLGIVHDIATLMMKHRLNIKAMEVEQVNGFAKISIEIESDGQKLSNDKLLNLFSLLPKIDSQNVVRSLPHEKRERWFRTVFDAMSEGVISVNADGIVNTVNKVACRILGMSYHTIVGRHVAEISFKECILQECIEKRIPLRRRKSVLTGTGRIYFYGSAEPICDSEGRLVGAVLLMKNLKEVKEMVDAVSGPLEICFDDIIGESSEMVSLKNFARKVSTMGTILSINGESGTGKELFARAIHFESGRTGPFVPVNCAALPEQLIESELFGYVDGAFTGAQKKGKQGLFESAGKGTIFLDEIGDMPAGLQAKILRVLQDGCVRRIGGFEEIPVDARVVTATNKNLKEMVEKGEFREDLFYRINVLTIQIPPLKERLCDLPLLVNSFLQRFNRKLGKEDQIITSEALEKLRQYDWPGNVRELQNVIERAAILSDGIEIRSEAVRLSSNGVFDSKDRSIENSFPSGKSLKQIMSDYEVNILLEALNSTASIRKAAFKLGLSHTALLKKISKYQITNGNNSCHWNILVPTD